MATLKGHELADLLLPVIGHTSAIVETCSLIARHATTYDRIQETWCNEEMSDAATAKLERREAQLERRIRDLVESLPETDEGPFAVRFQGDPRGWTVLVVCPDDAARVGGVGSVGVVRASDEGRTW